MSPLIFDASQNEEQARREQLERELEEQKELARQKTSNALPAREENTIFQPHELTPHEQESQEQEHQQQPPLTQKPESGENDQNVRDSQVDAAKVKVKDEKRDEEQDTMATDAQLPPEADTEGYSETPPEGTSEDPIHVQVEPSEVSAAKSLQRDPQEYSELMRTEKPTRNPLAALAIRPPNTYFDSQHNKEEILMVLRQHPIVTVGWILLSIVLILLPFTLFPLLPLFSLIPDRFQFFALIGWYLLVLAYMIENFLYWYFNIYIITDERIVDVDFYSLIYRALSSAKIENIQDTTASTKGVLGAIFNFGDVSVQTAAEKREFEFLNVPQPSTVTKFLNELILEEEREKLEGRIM